MLLFIHAHTIRAGHPPSLREIGAQFKIGSTNGVNDHLRALERKGLLKREMMLSRSARATPLGLKVLGIEAEEETAPGLTSELHRLRSLLARSAMFLTEIAPSSPLLAEIRRVLP